MANNKHDRENIADCWERDDGLDDGHARVSDKLRCDDDNDVGGTRFD